MSKFLLEKTKDGKVVIAHYIQGHRYEEFDTKDKERMLAYNLLTKEVEQIEIIKVANRRNRK